MELDLDWCYYLATTILKMSEEEFFKCTPKKLFKLAEIHRKVNSKEQEVEIEDSANQASDIGVFIDTII